PWTWVTGLSAALGVPLAAAAVPLARGTRIPVREALSDFGVDSHSFGSTRLDRILVAVSGPSRLLLLVTRNTLRRRRRFFWTVSALAASGVLFLSALNFRASLVHTLNRAFAATSSDLSVSFDRMYPIDALIHGTRSVPGIARAEAWTLTEASLVTADDQPTALSPGSRAPGQGRTDGRFTVLGLPSATQLIHLEMLAGRPLAPADSDAIVLNSALQSRYPALAIGDTLHLRTGSAVTSWHVIGFCREPFSPALAYVSQRRLNDLSGQAGMANHLRIALHAANAARLATDRAILDRTYEHDAIRVTGSITPADARYGFDQHLLMIYSFLLVTAALVAWIGGLNLVTSTTLNAIERQREIGVLRAIGATTRWIVLLVVAESVFTSLVSWLLAVLLAWPVSKAFGDWLVFALFHTGLDFRFDPLGPPLWLAFSLLLALAAGVPPAIRTARVTIYNALAAT
ncbi:MAG TPA: ABC transporter permease, partial [Acidobacteriaceae bacterium]